MGWTDSFVYNPTITCLSVSHAPAKEHLLKWSLKLWSGCKIGCLSVSMSVCDLGYVFSSGLGIMESSLFPFFLLLCLASCSHHLALGFENQAKSLPPEWHENIPTYTQPPCRSLSCQPQTTGKDNRVGGLNGILRNLMGPWRRTMWLLRVKIHLKWIKVKLFCARFESRIKGAIMRLPSVFLPSQNFTISREMHRVKLNKSCWRNRQADWRREWVQSSSDLFV